MCREVVDEAGIQFWEHSVHNEQYLGGQNAMVGGQKQWGGCASLPLTSGVCHPIERVPYGGLCIILNSCATHYECVELKQYVVLSSVLRHCVNHEPRVSLFSFWGVWRCWYILFLSQAQLEFLACRSWRLSCAIPPAVRNIYVLNRASGDPRKKHTDCFADKSFNPALLSSEKLVPFLEGDATQKGPRLSKEIYDSLTSNPRDLSWTGCLQLVSNIAIIFHNAWRLDFILSLASFESNIRGTRNIVGPARASAHMVPPWSSCSPPPSPRQFPGTGL